MYVKRRISLIFSGLAFWRATTERYCVKILSPSKKRLGHNDAAGKGPKLETITRFLPLAVAFASALLEWQFCLTRRTR